MALFSKGLLPASFRGVPFAVRSSDHQFGRRVAMHVYPGRDEPWAEDMGRAPRRFTLRGFILANDKIYVGGPIQLQRLQLTAAVEKAGPGILTHPTLGVLNVVLLQYSCGEDLGAGTMTEVSFEFVEAGKKGFPSLLPSGSGLLSAANILKTALAADLVRAVIAASGIAQSSDAKSTGRSIGAVVTAAAEDATSLSRIASLIPGNFGRFAGGGNTGYLGSNGSPYPAGTRVSDLIGPAAADREAVATAADSLSAAIEAVGSGASYQDVAASIDGLVETLLAACADPAEALRILANLIDTDPAPRASTGATGAAMITAFRRALGAAIARVVSDYQAHSYDDAFAMLADVSSILADLATAAADAGDDASFDALRSLRAEVVRNIRERGAQLARTQSFTLPGTMPALAAAQRLYADGARAEQLTIEARARHPLFLPPTFQALAA